MDGFDKLLTGYARDKPQSKRLWFQTAKVVISYELEEYVEARNELEQMDNAYSRDLLRDWYQSPMEWLQFKAMAFAYGGPTGDLARQLAELSKNPTTDVAAYRKQVDELTTMGLALSNHPEEKRYWQLLRDQFEWRRDYAAGKPVTVGFEQGVREWNWGSRSDLEMKDDYVLFDSRNSDNVDYFVQSPSYFPPPKIIDYEYEVVEDTPFKLTPSAGNIFQRHLSVLSLDSTQGHTKVGMDPMRNELLLLFKPGEPIYRFNVAPKTGNRSHVRVYCAEKFLEVHVDGQFIMRTRFDNITVDDRLTFMACPYFEGRASVKFHDPTVQRWSEGAPPDESDATALRNYYQQATTYRPTEAWLWFNFAVLTHYQGDYEQAESLFSKAIELGMPADYVYFYRGDMEERRGHREKALDEYRQCILSQQLIAATIPGLGHDLDTPREWAKFRLRWLTATEQPTAKMNDQDQKVIRMSRTAPPEPWLNDVLLACEAAAQNDFPTAVSKLEPLLTTAPTNCREMLNQQIESYRLQKRFALPADKSWYYLQVKMPLFWPIIDEPFKQEMRRLMKQK